VTPDRLTPDRLHSERTLWPRSGAHLALWMLLVVGAGIVLGSLVGCVPQEAIDQAEVEVSVHRGVLRHASTAPLTSAQWLEVYQASAAAWEAQHRALSGSE